jgi:uncharacterized protein
VITGSLRGRRWRRWSVIAAALLLAWWGLGLAAAWSITAPRAAPIPVLRELHGHAIEDVATRTRDGVDVRGWFVRANGSDARRVVVLVAGIRGNRLAMRGRAEFYLARGWSALLVDLRGTGASEATRISLGYGEALDLCAWHEFLVARGCTAIGAHGQSLGAAAIVYAARRGSPAPAWHFVVLESCYGDVREALAARLPGVPAFLTWPLVASTEWLLGIDANELVPARVIAALTAPLLLVCGDADAKVGPGATATLFATCGARDKVLCGLPGVGHVDLWRAGDTFSAALATFLAAR